MLGWDGSQGTHERIGEKREKRLKQAQIQSLLLSILFLVEKMLLYTDN